jgi:O-antigen/teichoic acid export membrane protein
VIKFLKDNFKLLKVHKGFLKYSKNTSWLFAEQILRMTIGLFVGIWVARYLGPSQFGLFSYVQAFVFIFASIASLGLDSILVRELVKDENKRDVLMGTAFLLKFMSAFIVFVLILIVLEFTSDDHYTNTLAMIVASATIFQSFNVISFYFQSTVLSKYTVYATSISFLISSIVKIVLITIEAPLVAFAWVILIDSILIAVGLVYFYIKNNSIVSIKKLTFKLDIAVSLLKDSWPVIISGIAIVVYIKIDQLMIKEFLGDGAVGQYAAAVRLSEVWYFVPMVLATSLFPAIINAKKISQELYYERLQKFYSMMFWTSIAIAVPVTFLAEGIINLLYGGQYNQAGSVLTIHIWAGVFVFMGVAGGRWMLCENLQLISTFNTLVGAISNIMLNIILIPKYGINGAAIATIISYAISGYLMMAVHRKTRINFINLSKSIIIKF